MNDSIFAAALKWIWSHKPDVAILVVMFVSGIWLTHKADQFIARVDNMDERIGRLEERMDRLEERMQRLEERLERFDERMGKLEKEVSEIRIEMNEKFNIMQKRTDEQFFEIRSYLIKMDTYLSITSKDYPKNKP